MRIFSIFTTKVHFKLFNLIYFAYEKLFFDEKQMFRLLMLNTKNFQYFTYVHIFKKQYQVTTDI